MQHKVIFRKQDGVSRIHGPQAPDARHVDLASNGSLCSSADMAHHSCVTIALDLHRYMFDPTSQLNEDSALSTAVACFITQRR